MLGTPTQVPGNNPRFVFLEEGEEPPKPPSQLERESLATAKLNQSADTQSTFSAVVQVLSEQWDEVNSQFAAEEVKWQERRLLQRQSSGSGPDSERSESPVFQSDLMATKGGGKGDSILSSPVFPLLKSPTAGTVCVAEPRGQVQDDDVLMESVDHAGAAPQVQTVLPASMCIS